GGGLRRDFPKRNAEKRWALGSPAPARPPWESSPPRRSADSRHPTVPELVRDRPASTQRARVTHSSQREVDFAARRSPIWPRVVQTRTRAGHRGRDVADRKEKPDPR